MLLLLQSRTKIIKMYIYTTVKTMLACKYCTNKIIKLKQIRKLPVKHNDRTENKTSNSKIIDDSMIKINKICEN